MIDSKTSRFFKGIAILMVIGSHYAAGMYVEAIRLAAKAFVESLGSYGVDIFFLLSGYGLIKSYEKSGINKRFVIRRLCNTYVPYIVIVGFCSVVLDGRITDIESFINLLTGGDYWFMHTLFFMYISFMIVYKVGLFKEVVITLIVAGYSLYMFKDGRNAFWVVSNGAFLIGIYAATLEGKSGAWIKERFGKIGKKLEVGNVSLVILGFGIMLAAWFSYSDMEGIISQTLMNMSFTLAVLGLCLGLKGCGKVIPALGQYTLYIYLLHMRLFWLIIPLLPQWNYARLAVVTSAISLVICAGFGYVMDKLIGLGLKRINM